MYYPYILTPMIACLTSGIVKYLIHTLYQKKRTPYHSLMGYGGMPSTHAAIVGSMTTLIGLKEGLDSPLFGISFTFMLIILFDAYSLRRHMQTQAILINQLNHTPVLKEQVGHTLQEIIAGMCWGVAIALLIQYL